MHSRIVNVRARTLGNIVTVSRRLSGLAEMFLLVSNVMFRACDDARALDAFHGLGELNPRQDWIRTEMEISVLFLSRRRCEPGSPKTFPVPSAFWRAAQRSRNWTQLYVRPLVSMFGTHCHPSGICKPSVECGGNIDTGWEDRVVIRYTLSAIRHDSCGDNSSYYL